MKAGRLDRRITIQRNFVLGNDGHGNQITEWRTIVLAWASMAQQSGREFFAAGTITEDHQTVFTMRWKADILVTDRVVYQGTVCDIHEAREIGRKAGLELHCTVRSFDNAG